MVIKKPRQKITIENPRIMEEWDAEKNIGIDPESLTGGSNKIVWWKCKLGHTWWAQINKRFSRKQKCPYCAGQKVWVGFNDLTTTHPDISEQWDYEKNGELRPEHFTIGADKKIWWNCKCGHSWQALLYSRKNCGCPSCAGNILTPGTNDLQTVNPKLALEWDIELNDSISPNSIAVNSNKKMWWRCKLGHSWQAGVAERNRGNGCPYCANRALLRGFNDLLTAAPKLAAEWNYIKNKDLHPEDVIIGSHRMVWWVCKYGHEWQAKISNRLRGNGCPYDAGKIVIAGKTDLKTRYPKLCGEWDDVKNTQTPDTVACYSSKLFWWVCPKGHSYQASASNRVKGTGCPYCKNKRPIIGETDFATVHPELVDEWDTEKNKLLRPQDVIAGSHKKVWWRCKEGHSWKTAVYFRHYGSKCPVCSRFIDRHPVIVGKTDLATLYPAIAEEWDIDANDGLTPQDVLPHSNRTVWWKCKRGHRWQTKVQARIKGTVCPRCKGKTPMRTRIIQ